jgi:clan AA aspartic protease (TIGR02281 family)
MRVASIACMSDAYGPSSGTMLRRAFMLVLGCGAAAYSLPRYLGDMGFGADDAAVPSIPVPSTPHRQAAQGAPKRIDDIPVAEPPATETYRAQRGNQFYVTASVNGNQIHFLVDTGATSVSLTPDDAKTLGFDLATLNWSGRSSTANGVIKIAPVTLGDIRLGRIVEYNVAAVVMPTSGISLLGMTFLSRLRSWQISKGVLTIAS